MSRMTENLRETARADIGIVCALTMEVTPFLRLLDRPRKYVGGDFVFRGGQIEALRVAVVESGPGATRAERATHALLDGHSPKWVISVGFCGGLQPNMRCGDLIVANSVSNASGESLVINLRMPADPDHGLFVGTLLTVDQIVRTVEEKQSWGERTGAIGVDLESYAVATVCRDRKVPFMAIRTVSDPLEETLAPEVLTLMGKSPFARVGAVAGALWKRPSSIQDLWKLREKANSAAQRLAPFLVSFCRQLGDAD